ncbi:ATP-dependent RNA helicase DEAH13-like isoform X2 [Asparagus officinalis]|uniref:ATP-dependent RNA helicase DEAH13-like isoform X1 n=1 Tax=Asparagus officinalis TaxID=4686 RepID=UPI00098E3716|nr:ATP-dependent RNA helicase DEAH13-like isoform X1 [Asparagus officinalis]XP_020272991.1 ATP-dependent RNA helicase DEAH13-like isoform X2 [Asparagus officinalis]
MEATMSNSNQIEGIGDGWDSGMDGSNALILPEKKKSKIKETGKGLKKRKDKQAPPVSKSKLKKMKKLLEEKEKKLLQNKSIEILKKHKLWDGAYSLLQSSGTIGHADTVKEKRRRAVQLSKAGLEVPEDLSWLKSKKKKSIPCDEEAVLNHDFGQSYSRNTLMDNDAKVVECLEVDDRKHSQAAETRLEEVSKISTISDGRSNPVTPPPECIHNDSDICVGKEQNDAPSVLGSCKEGKDTRSQDQNVCNSIVKDMEITSNNKFQHLTAPVVVHVSRPKDIELKRRDLPIIMMEQEIMEAVNEHSIVILCGETGCGKTTQVPQFLYEAGFGSKNCNDRKGIIGVTQPRRVAVLATAKRVSFELGYCLGKEVGFQVRHDKRIGDRCSIKFMTDGILLREVQSDFLLRRYSVIVLDEAHERSLNTDILVGMLSRVIKLREVTIDKLYLEQQEKILSGVEIDPDKMITKLKIILMSATLRVEDFISGKKLFHETPPILEVPVRQFPVTIHFSKKTHEDYLGQAYKKVMLIHKKLPPGGILVFVTGQREVEFLCKKLRKASKQLITNNSKRNSDNDGTANLDMEMKDIHEAFEISTTDQQTDRFSSFEEDDNFPEMDSDSSNSETDSDIGDDTDTETTSEKTDLVLDLLGDSRGLLSLKASFEALAGKSCNQNSKEEPTAPMHSKEEETQFVPSTMGEQAEPTPVGPLYVLPLYAMLPASSQLRVFEEVPEGERQVVVATNVAETSLTIPGIKYVVDTGKEKVKHYNIANGMETFEVQWISRASAAQRAGRAGRTGPGHCYRLYSSAAFSKDDLFPEFSCPEISKIPVDGVVLLMKSMGIDKVANFPFPTPPDTRALVEAEHCLKALQALDMHGKLTPIGRAMAQYPLSPRHSRMLLTVIQIMKNQRAYARANLVLGYAIATASALSFPNPFKMQFDGNHGKSDGLNQEEISQDQESKKRLKKEKVLVKEARARLRNLSSDALTFAYALQLFELAENQFEFCQKHSLHVKTMEDMSKLRKQLLQLIFYQSKFSEEFGWDHGSAEEVEMTWRVSSIKHPLLMNEEELLGQAICAGWADRVAKRVRKISESSDKVRAVRYQSCALDDTIYLHRWSSVSQSAPEFVVYTELLQTNRPYMHGATSVKSEWLVKYASSLCSFSAPLTDPKPYYEPLSDEVLCWVSPVFGRHNWQLPLHSLPIKNDGLRVSVFACGLLEGSVLPCMRTAQKLLAMSPSNLLKPEALGQRRVGDLLNGLRIGSRRIDSRARLRDAWNENPRHLYSEIKNWFQERFHGQFEELWEQMHHEVLEGPELFRGRAKKENKKPK